MTSFARFGDWPTDAKLIYGVLRLEKVKKQPFPRVVPGDGRIPDDLRSQGIRARAFYLEHVKPVEDRSTWGPWGLVPPADVQPVPTFAPFVPADLQAQAISISTAPDLEDTTLATLSELDSDDLDRS